MPALAPDVLGSMLNYAEPYLDAQVALTMSESTILGPRPHTEPGIPSTRSRSSPARWAVTFDHLVAPRFATQVTAALAEAEE